MEKIKPCPFCGGEAASHAYLCCVPSKLEICCTKCGACRSQYIYDSEFEKIISKMEKMIAEWNRRANDANS